MDAMRKCLAEGLRFQIVTTISHQIRHEGTNVTKSKVEFPEASFCYSL